MANRYYITNGAEHIAIIPRQDGTSAPKTYTTVKNSYDYARRFKYQEAEDFWSNQLGYNQKWSIQKVCKVSSHKNYIITTATNFVSKNASITNNLEYAKEFKSVADAEAYINNHREVKKSLGEPIIINDKFEVVERSVKKEFTESQLKEFGIYKPKIEPRITVSTSIRRQVYDNAGGKCELCYRPLNYNEFTLDHIQPLIRSGKNELSNYRCLCGDCNKLKGGRLDSEMFDAFANVLSNNMQAHPEPNRMHRIIRGYVRGVIADCVGGKA